MDSPARPEPTRTMTKTRRLIRGLVLGAGLLATVPSARPADATVTTKDRELMELLHSTDELVEFRASIAGTIDRMKQTHPEMPAWFWEALAKEVSIDDYAHWCCDLFDQTLTEEDLHHLNGVFSSPAKKELYEKIGALAQSKQGEDFQNALADLKIVHGAAVVDEMIDFFRSPAWSKYTTVLARNEAAQREERIKLLVEADHRIRARQPSK